MKIRSAAKSDIPFIANAILKIEEKGDSNTYSNLFSVDSETAFNYIQKFLQDDENVGTELSLGTFIIAEIEGEPVACCSLIFTNHDYYLNKSEIFPVHLSSDDLNNFLKNARSLPDHKNLSQNKYFIEYIFVDEKFRGKGIAEKLIDYQIDKVSSGNVFINVFENNEVACKTYKKSGFEEYKRIDIDTEENKIYPALNKIIMSKKI